MKGQKQTLTVLCSASLCLALGACGNSPDSGGAPGALRLSLSSSMALAPQDGTPAGTYSVEVTATDGGSVARQNLAMVVAVAGALGSTVDQIQGVNGKLAGYGVGFLLLKP